MNLNLLGAIILTPALIAIPVSLTRISASDLGYIVGYAGGSSLIQFTPLGRIHTANILTGQSSLMEGLRGNRIERLIDKYESVHHHH